MTQNTYSRSLRRATLFAFLVPIALALPLSWLLRDIAPGENFWLVLSGGLLVVGTTFAACVPWWRKLDDMQKHGHMISWYWGGMGGGLVMLIWLIAALGVNSDQSQGALALLIGQFVGFLLHWAVWMWRRRGEAS